MIEAPLNIPLCVDLDGTLIKGDTSCTAALTYAGFNPLKWLSIVGWFLQGRHAYMKRKFAEHVTLTPDQWDFVPGMLKILEEEKKAGRPLYLVSATYEKFAHAVAQDPRCHGYFNPDHVIATKDEINLRGEAKAHYLVNYFGEKQYIYAGNSFDDLPVWQKGISPIIVVKSLEDKLLMALKKQHAHPMVVLVE